MEDLGKFIESLSSILWPAIFIWVLYYFREAFKTVLESAKGRKFTLKIAGNELTMEEVTEQQRTILADLQDKVAKLEELYESSTPTAFSLGEVKRQAFGKILWVDDKPKNNSFLVSHLSDFGLEVHIAKSTAEAKELLGQNQYYKIISDMGRPESDTAGIDLLKYVRASNVETPYFIFCGGWAARNMKNEFVAAGGNGITSSGTTLLKMLEIDG
ncbi:Response regulator receiver domain-containing protein [Halopseudomonas sabulinigri]|uniref:Response regulator receiver domain-containing protein n=1 Tax=Halopseudomonas sabulinigri TaxID=472181 RepID=A0A1H1N6R9_9GAMM|nr:response regulator [Halopseudomonas sabulinigri]SDR94733.1 Response regulator receiver domain-containing protein [Halopseudomonas sabulinigri]